MRVMSNVGYSLKAPDLLMLLPFPLRWTLHIFTLIIIILASIDGNKLAPITEDSNISVDL